MFEMHNILFKTQGKIIQSWDLGEMGYSKGSDIPEPCKNYLIPTRIVPPKCNMRY